MTVAESKGLKKGSRVYWRGDAADSGRITGMSWDAVTIAWDNGQVATVHHGDMREIHRAPTKRATEGSRARRCQSSDAVGGEADMPRPPAPYRCDATDPGCVKTHTSAKCRKYHSLTRHRTSRRQLPSTP